VPESFVTGAVLSDAQDCYFVDVFVRMVEFDDGDFFLGGVVAHLRDMDDGAVHPAGERVGRDDPVDGVLRRAGWNQRADDKPSVVVLVAPIEKREVTGAAFDDHALGVGFRHDREAGARSERSGFDVAVR